MCSLNIGRRQNLLLTHVSTALLLWVTGIAVTIAAVHRSARTATRAVTLDLTRKGNRYGARVVLHANTPFYTRARVCTYLLMSRGPVTHVECT